MATSSTVRWGRFGFESAKAGGGSGCRRGGPSRRNPSGRSKADRLDQPCGIPGAPLARRIPTKNYHINIINEEISGDGVARLNHHEQAHLLERFAPNPARRRG